jgi:hypothetical protein
LLYVSLAISRHIATWKAEECIYNLKDVAKKIGVIDTEK